MAAMTGMIENSNPIPLAQITMGTASLLARALGIPTTTNRGHTHALETGISTSMDVGFLVEQQQNFSLVAGAGWEARLIKGADRKMKNRLGFFDYGCTGVKNLVGLRDSKITLTVDREVHQLKGDTVDVINVGEIYRTGISLGDNLSPHDGKLNVAITTARALFGLFKLVFHLISKRFDDSRSLHYFAASKIEVSASPALPLQANGEAVGSTPLEIEIVPDGVFLVVPPDYAEAEKLKYKTLWPPSEE